MMISDIDKYQRIFHRYFVENTTSILMNVNTLAGRLVRGSNRFTVHKNSGTGTRTVKGASNRNQTV